MRATDQDRALNRIFLEHLGDPAMKKTAEERSMAFLKARVYEDCVFERILPSTALTPSDCDRTESTADNPTLLRKIIDKEFTGVRATKMDFRGGGEARYVDTDTYSVDLNKIESDEFTITEGELRAKEQPIQSLIKHHTSHAIDEAIDEGFFAAARAAVADSGQARTSTDSLVMPRNFVKLQNILDGRSGLMPLRAATVLMTVAQKNNFFTWFQNLDNGGKAEDWKDGYKYDFLNGIRIVTTDKTHLMSNDEMFVFAAPEYLGHHFHMNDDRFQIETRFDNITWKAWKTHGGAIGNNYAVGLLTLNSQTDS